MRAFASIYLRTHRICCVLIAALLTPPSAAWAQGAGVQVNIRFEAESIEVLRAWRRANHLEPPDVEADAKLRERLAAQASSARDSASAARERRRLRTFELIPVDGTQGRPLVGVCATLPTETDPCTRVVQYDPANGTQYADH